MQNYIKNDLKELYNESSIIVVLIQDIAGDIVDISSYFDKLHISSTVDSLLGNSFGNSFGNSSGNSLGNSLGSSSIYEHSLQEPSINK